MFIKNGLFQLLYCNITIDCNMTIEQSYNSHIEKLSIEIDRLQYDFAIKQTKLVAKYVAKGMNKHLIAIKVKSNVYRDIERIDEKKNLLFILQTSKKMDCN